MKRSKYLDSSPFGCLAVARPIVNYGAGGVSRSGRSGQRRLIPRLAVTVLRLFCLSALAATSVKAAHELIYVVDFNNNIVSFYSDAPGAILSSRAITGMSGAEQVLGICWDGGMIYVVGSSSRLYTINPSTGAATQVGAGQFVPLVNGQAFGVGIQSGGGVRVVSDLRQDLLIDRTTGAVIANDPPFSYAPGDPHAGANPFITALAFDAPSGKWYAGDSVQNSFALLVPTTGVLTTIGNSGIDFSRDNGLDISPSTGIMYLASPAASSDPAANLYTVDKATGAVTLVGLIGNVGDNILIHGLTVAPTSQAVDIGLRVFDGTTTVRVACEAPASGGGVSSSLRIAKNGTIYGIVLVDPTDPAASGMRVRTSSGIKAWKRLP